MKLERIIFFFTVVNCICLKNVGLCINVENTLHDDDWLFDIKASEDNEINENKYTNDICQTNACKTLGEEFIRGMNKSVDPCHNFYEFVCGSFKSRYKIPGYTPVWSRINMFQETVYHRLKKILEKEPERTDILPVRQAKKWYRACMNSEELEEESIRPMESILMQLGGWPMTMDPEEWDENGPSWQRIEQYYFYLTGSYIFYDIKPRSNPDDGITLNKGKLPLFEKLPFYFRNFLMGYYGHYIRLILEVVQLFIEYNHANVSEEKRMEDLENMVLFEREIFMLGLHSNKFNEDKLTIGELVEWYNRNITKLTNITNINKINFQKLIKKQFGIINYSVNDSTTVIINKLEYYVNLTVLLNNTPKRTIVNYLHWHFVSDMLFYTTEKMRNLLVKFMKNEFGITEREPRWLECTKEMKMTRAASYAFVTKYFSNDIEKAVLEMIENIRKVMISEIGASNWLDKQTKEMTIDKLNDMRVFIEVPDWYKNETKVLNSYKGLVVGTNYFDNLLSYKKYSLKEKMRATNTKEHNIFDTNPLLVNAFYQARLNMIGLPPADFQPPLFTTQLPSAVNYGVAGSLIGHEMGHGFDINGITYGKDGTKTKIAKQVMEVYYKRAECFLDQFNKYYGVKEPDYEGTTPPYGVGSPGRRTRGENMADTTGLQSVFEAYKKNNQKDDIKLPGFEEYTNDQMFFISFGASWCELLRPKYKKLKERNDIHSPANLRVIGAVSNTNDFAKAFNCPKDSPMNPENKCNIWKFENNNSTSS